MKTLKLWLSVAFLIVIISPAFTQLQEGYIITNTGDSIKGFIFISSNYRNSKFINFKPDPNSEYVNYNPSEIKGFIIGKGEVYLSTKLHDPALDSLIFLREMVNGPIGLYERATKAGKLFVVKEANGNYFSLKKKVYYGLLKYHFNKCDKIDFNSLLTARTIKYTPKSLVRFITKYNACLYPDSILQIRNKNKIKIKKGLRIGLNNSVFNIKFPYYQEQKYSQPGFDLGIYLNVPLSVNFSLLLEGVYSYRGGKGSKKSEVFPTAGYYMTHHNFSAHFANFPLLLNYQLPGKLLQPYINLGPNIIALIKLEGSATIDSSTYTGIADPKPYNILEAKNEEIDSINIGLNGGLGLNIPFLGNKTELNFELRYNLNFLSSGVNHLGNLNTLQILAGIGF